MKIRLTKFRDWCTLNSGVFTFLAFVTGVIAIIPLNKIDLISTYSFFESLATILVYRLQVPLYLFLLLLTAGTLYFFKIKKRYQTIPRAPSVLKGKWKNEWVTSDGRLGNETAVITNNMEYIFEDGRHFFNLKDIKVNPTLRQIEFMKVAAQPDDKRKLFNKLTIENNDLLVGTEDNNPIKYVRIEN
jgi:hypothetical protein